MILLVDIGNTRLKWMQYQAALFSQAGAITHVNQNVKLALLASWDKMQAPQKIYLAAVSSTEISQALFDAVETRWPGTQVQEIYTEKFTYGVTNAYSRPEKLGVDRWLALLAAYHHYTPPICIVDCGTAITLDIVDQQGMHLGGMIMPGLTLLKQSLQTGTAGDLNTCAKLYQQGLANDTEGAIFNGNLNAVRGFIEFGIAQYKQPLQLIICGGDAEFIAKALKLDAILDTALVFKGLALSSGEWEG